MNTSHHRVPPPEPVLITRYDGRQLLLVKGFCRALDVPDGYIPAAPMPAKIPLKTAAQWHAREKTSQAMAMLFKNWKTNADAINEALPSDTQP